MGKSRHWGAPLRLGVGLGQAERQFPESATSKGDREVMRVPWWPLSSYQEGREDWYRKAQKVTEGNKRLVAQQPN